MIKMTQQTTEIQNRIHRSKADYGVNDYYRAFKAANKESTITRKAYGQIIKEYNSFLRDGLSTKGRDILFPKRMGRAELRKSKTEVKIDVDGKIINNLPVNWKETRKLWLENERAREMKIKIRFTNEHTDSHTFKITYLKSKADFKNKSLYTIKFNRQLKRDLSQSIFKGKIDAFVKEF
jgi:hypothetical protein